MNVICVCINTHTLCLCIFYLHHKFHQGMIHVHSIFLLKLYHQAQHSTRNDLVNKYLLIK